MRRGLMLAVIIMILLMISLPQCAVNVRANPIPSVPAFLEAEYINISIEKISEKEAVVLVDGVYPMRFTGEGGFIYFPIPREALNSSNITVLMDGKSISYNITWRGTMSNNKDFQYESSFGVLPMICFKTNASADENVRNIRIIYTYKINVSNHPRPGTFATIYAMGTGRYYMTYAKECTAHVNIWVKGFKGYKLTVILTSLTKFSETVESDMKKFYLEKTALFGGIRDDLIIVLEKGANANKVILKNISLDSISAGKGYITGRLTLTFENAGYTVELLGAELKGGAINVYLSVKSVANKTGAMTAYSVPVNFILPYDLSSNVSSVIVNIYVNGEFQKSILAQLGSFNNTNEDKNNEESLDWSLITIPLVAITAVLFIVMVSLRRRF
ncbi:MAG TPA: hypothetical protein ENF25_00640 [Thermoprotei archaeon]|nr:hypothetical protein [Thermoprotei archaeon]